MTDLRDFVLDFCRLAGGIVEPPAYGVFDVLLPEPVAARLGLGVFQQLTFEEGDDATPELEAAVSSEKSDDGVTRLSYGHPWVEEMAEVTVAAPASALLHINAVRLEKRGLAGLARQTLTLTNARLTRAPRQTEARALHHYIRFTFKAAIISDEKHEQLVSVLMDAQNGYAVPELADPSGKASGQSLERQAVSESENVFKNLSVAPPRWLPSETNPLSHAALQGLLERATHAARDTLADPIAHLTRRAARFLELDRARLGQYYDDIERDLTRRRDRSSDENRRASIQEKLVAAQAERQAKLADVEAKYRLRVELKLLNLLVITLPKLTLKVEVKHRSTSLTRTVVWNPLLHQIEPLLCDVCGRPATSLTLCSGGHLVHAGGDCLLADDQQCVDCKRLFCRLCENQVETCVVCGQPVCRHSLNRCAECERGTCREHIGLCHAADGAPVTLEPETASSTPTAEQGPPMPPQPQEPAQEQEERPRLSSAKRQAAKRAAQKRQSRTTRRSSRPKGPKAAKIEVYINPDAPVVDAFVLSSGNKQIAVRTWERIDKGIGVWCQCEKEWHCPADRTLLDPAPPDEIDRQIWGEIGALRQEYGVSPRKVKVHIVVRGTLRLTPRLVLRGRWKE